MCAVYLTPWRISALQPIFEKKKKKIKLEGFNNLTKSVSFNIFDISYAPSAQSRKEYLEYIDEAYNADRLRDILHRVVEIIGAQILSSSTQDYDPLGASATLLISEHPIGEVFHLDKSHISAHTYPEENSKTGICTFRVDIDVSTCGKVSPLNALDFLIRSFDSDIVIMDYRVRGFTRDIRGKKHYIDHDIRSIQDFVDPKIIRKYNCTDVNNYMEKIFHTKMMISDFDLDNYLFSKEEKLSDKSHAKISSLIKSEMEEIFTGRNF
jgi:S-adenosylmethionine decarboxylase